MKKSLTLMMSFLLIGVLSAKSGVVTRNSNLRSDPSSRSVPVARLAQGDTIELLDRTPTSGYYHVQTADDTTGFVWARNVRVNGTATNGTPGRSAQDAPGPLLAKGHPVDWWFVFKFNARVFPGCSGGATRACPFGGDVQSYRAFSQQFVYASSEAHALQEGSDCLGDATTDPVGATFEEV